LPGSSRASFGGVAIRIALFLPHLGVSGGLGVHCRALLAALLEATRDNTFAVFAPADPKKLFPYSGLEDGWKALATDPRVELTHLDWPADLPLSSPMDRALAGPVAASKPDALLCSYYTGMEHPPCPQAVVFHDAGFLDFPEVFGDTARQRRETVERIRPALDLLVCVSADARERICRLLPFDPARSAVIWHALVDPPESLRHSFDPEAVDAPLWPGGDRVADWGDYFFLPVGAATGFNRQRKNVPTGVAGFRRLNAPGVRLVIASTGVMHEKMLGQLLPASELAAGRIVDGVWRSDDGAILVLPNLDRDPFLVAITHAKAVYYPTRYEGFGLPAIEAMALGVPLIAGGATSLPEVVGDAGLLVDPDDVDGFATAMRTVLTDPTTVATLVERGRERAKLFTLRRMGEEMQAVFERLTGKAHP
jgi:glycosyltransferase involved in cell wall biosynthesis